MPRIFVGDGREHPEPDPTLAIEKMLEMLADFLRNLAGATWSERPRGEYNVIEFTRRVGTKGEFVPIGRLVMTRNFKQTSEAAIGPDVTTKRIVQGLGRHRAGEWGKLSAEDIKTNNQALRYGRRLLSTYEAEFGFKVWIITEADHSAATIMLPQDY